MTSYWDRITDYYNENRKTPSERTKNSLQHRWSDIQKDTARFCGFYAEIERKRESGKSEDDKVNLNLFSFALCMVGIIYLPPCL
jgi:hypothetical protein